ncbi:MAG: amidohydrolase family protein [Planctomycetes bacterium]|nr:amidohydrolase family protein [Planctomycetota bacterium]
MRFRVRSTVGSMVAAVMAVGFVSFMPTGFAQQPESAASGPPPAKVALTGGRIIPVVGPEIATGTIVVEHGRITAVGPTDEVKIPYDAMEVDVSGKVVMPGMIDPQSWRGLDVSNENLPVAPFLDVYDAIDPSRLYFEDALRDGVLAIHVIQADNCVIGGLSRVVKPIGLTPDEMTIAAQNGIKMSITPKRGFDRMRQLTTLRETFAELDWYLEQLAEQKYEESLEEKEKKIDVGPAEARERGKDLIKDEDYDDKHANLMRLRRGDFGAWIFCGAAMDVQPGITLATDEGFLDNAVFILGAEAHKAVTQLKAAGRPVLLPGNLYYRERDQLTGELKEVFIPSEIHDAGLMFALQPNPGGSLAEAYLNYQAAMCVRNGIPRQTALEAITINPATMMGVGDELGSIEPGKIANLVVMSGDPFDFESWVELCYIDGILAYDRARDYRLEKQLELEATRAEQAKAEEDATKGKPDDDDGDDSAEEGDEATSEGASAEGSSEEGDGDGDGDGSGESGDTGGGDQ